MTVYIDQYPEWIVPKGHKFYKGGHLFGSDLKELHAFAQNLGLKREWYQGGEGSFPHYDLTKSKRLLALNKGATTCVAGCIPDDVIRHDPNS